MNRKMLNKKMKQQTQSLLVIADEWNRAADSIDLGKRMFVDPFTSSLVIESKDDPSDARFATDEDIDIIFGE